jgi:hypothetical protein
VRVVKSFVHHYYCLKAVAGYQSHHYFQSERGGLSR